jgi:hypothetical protein
MEKVTWEDWSRVFTTSRGQVKMAPTVPPHLGGEEGREDTPGPWKGNSGQGGVKRNKEKNGECRIMHHLVHLIGKIFFLISDSIYLKRPEL